MFNPDGGSYNVLIALLSLVGLVLTVAVPVAFVVKYDDAGISKKHVVALLAGLTLYCFLFYVANPSLSFWAVK